MFLRGGPYRSMENSRLMHKEFFLEIGILLPMLSKNVTYPLPGPRMRAPHACNSASNPAHAGPEVPEPFGLPETFSPPECRRCRKRKNTDLSMQCKSIPSKRTPCSRQCFRGMKTDSLHLSIFENRRFLQKAAVRKRLVVRMQQRRCFQELRIFFSILSVLIGEMKIISCVQRRTSSRAPGTSRAR